MANIVRMNPTRSPAQKPLGAQLPQEGLNHVGNSLSGPLYGHLGHFAQAKNLRAGHNTTKSTRKSGTYKGKSNKLGHGGRAQQLKDKGVPKAVIGQIARCKGAAPGGPNYHG